MGSTPLGDSENSFPEYFDLRSLLRYLHFILVTNPFSTIVFTYITPYKSHSMKCKSMLFVTLSTYFVFEAYQILFPTASLIFTSVKFFFNSIITISKTSYRDIQYTTLLTLLALLTTQYYITFSFTFSHTEREKKKEREELLTTFVLKDVRAKIF